RREGRLIPLANESCEQLRIGLTTQLFPSYPRQEMSERLLHVNIVPTTGRFMHRRRAEFACSKVFAGPGFFPCPALSKRLCDVLGPRSPPVHPRDPHAAFFRDDRLGALAV